MQESREGGPYPLGRLLSSGSTGDVFETVHPRRPGPCAIKILRPDLEPDALRAFRADLEAVSALRHPNVVNLVEVGFRPDGSAFVVTELLEGRSLAEQLAARTPVSLTRTVALVKGVAAGLQAAHHRGVVHGELNPRNVFLARTEGYDQGIVKLLDFGVARLRPVDGPASLSPDIVRYLSPEQAAGHVEEIDGRSDQFALALIAYRMLSGADAFPGDSALSLLYEIVHGTPALQPISSVGAEVEEVLRCGLAKDRHERHESITAFARAFGAAAGEETGVTPGRTTTPSLVSAPASDDGSDLFTHPFFDRPVPRRRRRIRLRAAGARRARGQGGRWFLLLVAVTLVSLLGAVAMGWRPSPSWRQSALWQSLGLP
jgi:serine/threonine-protein kinase